MVKRRMRWIAGLAMAALLLGSLCGCAGKDYAIKVGDQIITENDYKRAVENLRAGVLYAERSADTEEFWQEQTEGGITRAEEVAQRVQDQLITAALYEDAFDRLGLSFTAEEESTVTEAIRQVVSAYGSMTALNEALAASDYTYDEYVSEYYAAAKKNKVLSHLFPEVSSAQIEEYYKENYVYVKFIYISKEDAENGDLLTGQALADARAKADSALEAANRAGEIENFDDLIEFYADVVPEESKGVLVTNDATLDATFTKGALALEVGEVKLIETKDAFMVTKRVDGMGKEVFDTAVRRQILERIKAEDIAKMLEQWRSEVKIDFNKPLIKKYRADRRERAAKR